MARINRVVLGTVCQASASAASPRASHSSADSRSNKTAYTGPTLTWADKKKRASYASIGIDSVGQALVQYERDFVVMGSDCTFEDLHAVLAHLKKDSAWYNWNRFTTADLFKDLGNAKDWAQRKPIVKARTAAGRPTYLYPDD